jgi:hypothetical protein
MKKIYWVQDKIHSFVSFSTQKNITNKKMIRKTKDPVLDLNLGEQAYQKNLKPF